MVGKSTRRRFLGLMAATTVLLPWPTLGRAPAPEPGESESSWNQGDLAHLLPTANHERFLIKASFARPRREAPILAIGGRHYPGTQLDTRGYFWQFDATSLEPDTTYSLQLLDRETSAICDPWPLRTLPHPDQDVPGLRVLTYTCGGGDEDLIQPDGVPIYLSLADRRRLLERGLSFKPDLLIANGDHVYYDQRTMVRKKPQGVIEAYKRLFDKLGKIDCRQPILGSDNEDVIKRVGDRQIARLYGVRLRSTPVFMLTDDHDLFENDEADDELVTLPPDRLMMESARAMQKLYYPEFLPDANRPLDLPGSAASDRAEDVSEVFGTLRYGTLFEALLYDTKRYVNIDGAEGYMVPPSVEEWLKSRTKARDTAQLAHIPSTPMGWSAGKWGEWYPDILDEEGVLGTMRPKPHWPEGWWLQHQRLLSALGGQSERIPLLMSGDLHMFSAGKILASGDLDFRDNPIHALVVGPLGTGNPAFASAQREVLPQPPEALTVEEIVSPLEKNGFSIIDLTRDKVAVQFYAWRPPQPASVIDSMPPAHRFSINQE